MFPLPRVDELIDKTGKSKVYTTLDLHSAYHRIRIHPPDIEKTAFVTPFGHYEFIVLPFGLTNASATFQTLINSLLGHLPYVVAYIDDILIFSKCSKCLNHTHEEQIISQEIQVQVFPISCIIPWICS